MKRVERTTVCDGVPIFALAVDIQARLLLATGEGLFFGDGEHWQRAPHDWPHLNTVVAADECLFVAGPGGLARSTDRGESWQLSWLDQIESAITCLTVSPNFSRDRVLLAGTGRDGVLRSIDGGRHWELSNFGLREFEVLALAVAPQWERREVVFAAIEGGLYRSPNGGRAWKQIETAPHGIVQCLAISPQFAADATLYAGTESDGLYKSTDGGQRWKRIRSVTGTVNCLHCPPDEVWVGTNEGVSRLSTLTRVQETIETHAPVLCLAAAPDSLYAGTSKGVILRIEL